MADLVLSRVGATLGSLLPQPLRSLGVSLGRSLGARLGREVDAALFGERRRVERPRLDDLRVQASEEGASIPIVYGRTRVAGQVIWAARFKEREEDEDVGGKGGGASATRFRYSLSFAVGLCEGAIARVERCWANGAPLDLSQYAHRVHRGEEAQEVDPLIEAIEGDAPAYQGLAYVVFEDFPLDAFGAAVPQLSFEIVGASAADAQSLEALAQGVCLIPGSGEFVYDVEPVRRIVAAGREESENAHASASRANVLVALDALQGDLPNVARVSLVVSWFGDDLRCGGCTIAPRVESLSKETRGPSWRVDGKSRIYYRQASLIDGALSYGGTPSDAGVKALIGELNRRGLAVTLNPFLLMDIPADNALPDPYGGARQAAYPWRGRITCAHAGDDGTAAARAQVATFFEGAEGYRRFVLRYATLAQEAGGVEAFVIGSELRGLTRLRDESGAFPAVEALRTLAADVRAILGDGTRIVYAADWSEYGAYVPEDGSGDVLFPLDALWADENIDAVAVDWYPPLSDWRDGEGHADRSDAASIYDRAYLESRIEGGEAYAWHYATEADRAAQLRTPIADGAYGKAWMFRAKDLRGFWNERHFERIGGVERSTPTAWVPRSKPIWLNELGCPAIDKGANAPNVFLDPKSAESAAPTFSSRTRDDLVQRRALEAYLSYWRVDGGRNPTSEIYHGPMIARIGLWAWDARPFPYFPARGDVWSDGAAWRTGHWLNGRAGAAQLSHVVADLCARAGVAADTSALEGVVAGVCVETPTTARAALETLAAAYAFHGAERNGTVVFRHVGAGAVSVVARADLVDGEDAQRFTRGEEAKRPAEARVRFLDSERDYRVATAAARRKDAVSGDGALDLDLGLTLDAGQAEAIARAALADARAGGDTVRLDVAPWRLDLEAGDRVAIEGHAGVHRIERIEERAGGGRRLDLVREPNGDGRAVSGAEIGVGTILSAGAQPHVVFLDLPPMFGAESDERPLAAVYASPWVGPVELYLGSDTVLATKRGMARRPATIGALTAPLYPGPAGRWDDANAAYVRLPGATLASLEDGAALAGAMSFAVARPEGGWEIFCAREAALIGPEEYVLKGLLRGLQGTEPASGEPSPAGATVVRLDGAPAPLDVGVHERGATLSLIAPPSGRTRSDPDAATAPVELADVWARPFAPASLSASREAGGDIVFTWVRRARLGGDAWVGEVPLGEETEAYELQILVEGVLKRTLRVAAPTARYALADQIADFGAPASGFTASVAQHSVRYGAGRRRDSFVTL